MLANMRLALMAVTLLASCDLAALVLDMESSVTDCALKTSLCQCEHWDGGYDLWCPSQAQHLLRIHFKPRKLWMNCNHEARLALADLLSLLRGLNVGVLDSLVYEHCPIPQQPFARLTQELNVSNLKILRLVYGTTVQGKLVKDQFGGLEQLTDLEIRHTDITDNSDSALELDPSTFNHLNNLTYLSLASNMIRSLPTNLLYNLQHLKVLQIMEKNLQELPEGLFSQQVHLEQLVLNAEGLTKLSSDPFSGATQLTSLTLLNVRADSLSASLFASLPDLMNVTITSADTSQLPDDLFSNNSRLERFEWSLLRCAQDNSACRRTVEPGRFVRGLPSLNVFKLSRAVNIELQLPEDFFWGCGALHDVELVRIGLRELPSQLLRDALNLRRLQLQDNSLVSLSDDTFSSSHKLELINLRNNLLTNLSDRLLAQAVNLRTLIVSGNRLSQVQPQFLISQTKLEFLDLSDNQIVFDSESQPSWDSLTNLMDLDLHNNNISLNELPYQWRTLVPRLRIIDLSHNHIGPLLSFGDLAFRQSQGLLLNLSANLLHGIIDSGANSASTPEDYGVSSELTIDLTYNPLHCDCHLLPLLRQLHNLVRADQLRCHVPMKLSGVSVGSLQPHQLTCAFPSATLDGPCPEQCDCEYVPQLRMVELSCVGRHLSHWPQFLPLIMDADSVSLDLSHNLLTDLGPGVNVSNFDRLVRLNLSHNQLSNVPMSVLPPNLSTLALDNNQIVRLDSQLLHYLARIQHVRLGQNPYECSCASQDLFRFTRGLHRSVVADLQNVTVDCAGRWSPSSPLVLANLQDDQAFCSGMGSLAVVLYVLPVVVVVLLLLAAVILMLMFKQRLLIWLYARPVARKLFPNELDDQAQHYDVFISYANGDSDFVEDLLLPGLEGADNDMQFKCLVHTRDFVPGRSISEQIIEAVDSCSRTLIVLSEQFLASDWAQHEFVAAHSRNKAIVVVYGQLPDREQLSSAMWHYISTNTYLKSDDPYFWPKLRYALPHRGGWRRRQKKKRCMDLNSDQLRLVNSSRSQSGSSVEGAAGQVSDAALVSGSDSVIVNNSQSLA